MQQIINFVIRNKIFLLFLLLFGISLGLTIQSNAYQKSKFITSTNVLTGTIYESVSNVSNYFDLKKQNSILIEENNWLRAKVINSDTSKISNAVSIDSSTYSGIYKIQSAKIINNNYSGTKNYLTLNKGEQDSVKEDLGVITSKGILGIIDNTSRNYSRVLSILNTKSRINAQLKSSNQIGSLKWDGTSPTTTVQLTDISKFAAVKEGDTIITGGESTIFPKGILIGTIQSFVLDVSGDTYTIQVKLFNDMTNLSHAYIIENLNSEEIKQLENPIDE